MKLVSCILIVLALTAACRPKKSEKPVAIKPAAQSKNSETSQPKPSVPETAPSLVGTWSSCKQTETDSDPQLLSIEFTADGKFSAQQSIFKDPSCLTRFSSAEILSKTNGMDAKFKAMVVDMLTKAAVVSAGTWKEASTALGYKQLDMISTQSDRPSQYLAYKWIGNDLVLSAAKPSDGEEENPSTEGTSPQTRIINFDYSQTFSKVPK